MTLVADGATFTQKRRNLITNPAIRSLTGWVTRTGGGAEVSLVRSGGATPDAQFSAYASVTLTTPGTWWRLRSDAMDVVAGREYTASSWVRGSVGSIAILVVWQNSGGSIVSEAMTTANVNGGWDRISRTAVAPVGAVSARVEVSRSETDIGKWFHAVGFLFEESATLGDYFDGSTPNTIVKRHSWAGAADASASIESEPVAADRIDPLMVLGPWQRTVPLRTEVHQLLDSTEARFSTLPAGSPGGELRMLFATYAGAVDAAGKIASGRVWQMSEPIGVDPTPVTERMMFTGGEVTIEQSENAPGKFVLTAPWSAA